jgi:subtilase family serine protease
MVEMKLFKPYSKETLITPNKISNNSRCWFKANEIGKIYNFPTPDLTKKVNIGVVSFGGGLFGSVDSKGVLTKGDVQAYWSSLGISSENMPKVIIVPIDTSINNPSGDLSSTIENTIDIEQIGACFPSSNLTIYFYLAINSENGFINIFNYILNNTIAGVNKPNVVSISWGSPEANNNFLTQTDILFTNAILQGINICAASGDNGSSDGLSGLNVDFPASSPHVIACGGTTLICPNLTYDSFTKETVWSGSGGGLSNTFTPPSYQTKLNKPYRAVPDIALNADPNTGVSYLINGKNQIIGGTSIVSPAISAFIGLTGINFFANTKLYSVNYSKCFHDIIRGNNGYYNADMNYDFCTGLGSIDGILLLNAFNETTLDIPISSIILNQTTANINIGKTLQLSTTISPSNATNTQVSWISSNNNIATVGAGGLITGVNIGNCTITVLSGIISVVATINIVDVNSATQITVKYPKVTMFNNQSFYNNVNITPRSVPVEWSSSNSNIVSVDSKGLITSKSTGQAIITVKIVNSLLKATIIITVIAPRRR